MGIITKPYTFASGRVVDGTQINADFDALITGVGDTTTLRPTLASLGAVATNDSRLSDARLASDVYAWAKAATKPAYIAAEVGTAAYSEGTWTPVLGGGFTIVGAAPAVNGYYKRIGNLLFIECIIHAGSGGNTSVACTFGAAAITGYPAASFGGPCQVGIQNTGSCGVGTLTLGGGAAIYPSTFTAQTIDIWITVTYIAA